MAYRKPDIQNKYNEITTPQQMQAEKSRHAHRMFIRVPVCNFVERLQEADNYDIKKVQKNRGGDEGWKL